jgi:hypothetical protein
MTVDHSRAKELALRSTVGAAVLCECYRCVVARAYLDAVDTLRRCADAIEDDGHLIWDGGSHEIQQAAWKARNIAEGKTS